MNEGHLELKLLAGRPLEIPDLGLLYVPTLHEIIEIGEELYNQYLSVMLFNKANLDGFEDDEVDEFELFFAICYRDKDFRNICYEALRFFFRADARLGSDDEGVYIYLDHKTQRIDKHNYGTIQKLIKKANYIKIQTVKVAETMNLYSMISDLSWKNNGMILPQILDLTIYQMYNGFFATENLDNEGI